MQQTSVVSEKALIIHSISQESLDMLDDYERLSYAGSNVGHGVAITVHDIKQTEHGSVMGAGRLMTDADKQFLKDHLSGEQELRDCWLPQNLMMMNSDQMIWYVPSRKRSMYFKQSGKSIKLDVVWPSLVFRFTASGTLYVAAYAGKGAPKLSQPLYHAPIWNIYADTRLCAGTAETTNIIGIEAMRVWETAIFDTVFTHSNHRQAIATKKKNGHVTDAQYMQFIKRKAKSAEAIKAAEMVPLGKTLKQWAGGRA